MKKVFTKIVTAGSTWYASSLVADSTDAQEYVAMLNQMAAAKKLPSTYELATEDEYWAYREQLRTQLRKENRL